MDIDQLDLLPRFSAALEDNGYDALDDLRALAQAWLNREEWVSSLRGVGPKTLLALVEALESYDRRGPVSAWPREHARRTRRPDWKTIDEGLQRCG